jgi:hypothetical protein
MIVLILVCGDAENGCRCNKAANEMMCARTPSTKHVSKGLCYSNQESWFCSHLFQAGIGCML